MTEPASSLSVVERFAELQREHPDVATPALVMTVLSEYVQCERQSTLAGVERAISKARKELIAAHPESIPVGAAGALFEKHVIRILDKVEPGKLLEILKDKSNDFIEVSQQARASIARLGASFIRDGSTILVHGYSRTVNAILLHAAEQDGKRFRVLATEGRPTGEGVRTVNELRGAGIDAQLTLDCAVATALEVASAVLLGAESVVESGGIVNKIGSFQAAMCAQAMKKPVYVAVESFKFTRMYPLKQKDIPKNELAFTPASSCGYSLAADELPTTPQHDYTPAAFITLLLTDLGALTPSAVSDELIRVFA